MNITLKLFASLASYLPANAVNNEVQCQVENGTSVFDVLQKHQVPMETCHLILVNGVFTPPKHAGDKQLVEGDVVAVWPPVAGG